MLDHFILNFCDLLQAFYLFDVFVDLRINGGDGVLQPFDSDITSIIFFLALKGGYSPLIHLNLFVSVLQLSFQSGCVKT